MALGPRRVLAGVRGGDGGHGAGDCAARRGGGRRGGSLFFKAPGRARGGGRVSHRRGRPEPRHADLPLGARRR